MPACLQAHKHHNRFKDVDDKQKSTTTQFSPCVQFTLLHDNVLQLSVDGKKRGEDDKNIAVLMFIAFICCEQKQAR